MITKTAHKIPAPMRTFVGLTMAIELSVVRFIARSPLVVLAATVSKDLSQFNPSEFLFDPKAALKYTQRAAAPSEKSGGPVIACARVESPPLLLDSALCRAPWLSKAAELMAADGHAGPCTMVQCVYYLVN